MCQLPRKGSLHRSVTSASLTLSLVALAAGWPVGAAAQATGDAPASPGARSVAPSTATGRFEGPLVLRLPASARMLGMANAGGASNDGDAIFYNPGMLTQARGVAMSVQRYGSRATAGAVGSVQTIGALSVGIGAQLLQYGADARDPGALSRQGAPRLADGGDEPAASSVVTVGVGRAIKGYRVGAALKYAEERIGAARDGILALDLGMNMALGPATLAVSVQNLGAGPELSAVSGPLPTRVTVGYGGGLFPIWERWDIGMQTQLSVEADGFVRPAGGVELGYVPIEGVALVMRSGLRLPREPDEPLATVGLGITADRFSLDWALEPMRGGRPVSHRIGVRLK